MTIDEALKQIEKEILNKEALMLIDRLRCSVERLLSEIEEAKINISYMHAYKPLVKILDDCDAYDKNMESMGIYKYEEFNGK